MNLNIYKYLCAYLYIVYLVFSIDLSKHILYTLLMFLLNVKCDLYRGTGHDLSQNIERHRYTDPETALCLSHNDRDDSYVLIIAGLEDL